ncbi:MAG: hypothetical protein CMB80_15075 [Flammeovirgaceae bacterium]|nr:hypothetical protein [Flammeovirgaceae bacterium]
MALIKPTIPGIGDVLVNGDDGVYENQMSGYQKSGALDEVGDDIVTNGDFATDTNWTKGTGWTISGTADTDASQLADSDLTQTPATALVENKTYETTITVSSYVAGNVTVVVGGTEGTDRGSDATFVENILCGSGDDLDIRADVDGDLSVDDFAVKLANITWDMRLMQFATVTLTGNRLMDNPAEHVAGAIYTVEVTQDGTGSRLITWGSDFDFAGGTAPTLSTGAADVDLFVFQSNGSKLRMIDSILDIS